MYLIINFIIFILINYFILLFIVFGTKYSLVVAHTNLSCGDICVKLDRYDEAMKFFVKAEEVFSVIHLPDSKVLARVRTRIKYLKIMIEREKE